MCERGRKGGEERGDMRGEGRDDSRDRVQRCVREAGTESRGWDGRKRV